MFRLFSLDVLRGITIALMIVVNSPGNQDAYAWLQHSTWDGCTLADLVFPFFIVILGISSVLAFTNLKNKTNSLLLKIITKRSIYLFLLGLILNILPNHFHIENLRILGVLQRIAICYFFSSILFLTTAVKTQCIIIISILLAYWLLINNFSTDPLSVTHNLVGYLDQLILSPQHLYNPAFDPEGLLSTLPAIASALIGNLIGILLISKRTPQDKLHWLIIAGFGLSLVGLIWNHSFPINKSLWSSSYVLWSSGLCLLVFAVFFALIELKHFDHWIQPFVFLGQNALLIYILHVLFLKIQAIILLHNAQGKLINLRLYITELLFNHFSSKNASLCYAISYLLFWFCILKYFARYEFGIKKNRTIV